MMPNHHKINKGCDHSMMNTTWLQAVAKAKLQSIAPSHTIIPLKPNISCRHTHWQTHFCLVTLAIAPRYHARNKTTEAKQKCFCPYGQVWAWYRAIPRCISATPPTPKQPDLVTAHRSIPAPEGPPASPGGAVELGARARAGQQAAARPPRCRTFKTAGLGDSREAVISFGQGQSLRNCEVDDLRTSCSCKPSNNRTPSRALPSCRALPPAVRWPSA